MKSLMSMRCWSLLLAAGLAPGLVLGQRLPPSGYVGLNEACPVVTDEWWNLGEVRTLAVREPCTLPAEAVAVVLETQAQTLAGDQLRVKVWAADQAEPAHTVLDGQAQAGPTRHRVTTLVNLCPSGQCAEGDVNVSSSVTARLSGWVVGYFQPVASDDMGGSSSGEVNLKSTESSGNNYFGTGAGTSNTTGDYNAFFGGWAGHFNTTGYSNAFFGSYAGYSNTMGNENAFFGGWAGYSNTTGYYNAFFGQGAGSTNTTGDQNTFVGFYTGRSNTIENANSFFGYQSNGATGITNATALGYRAQVSQSNSLVLGSIAGVNDATESVNVGIGTDRPARQLHLSGPNATFRMDRPTDTAAFLLVRTNASGNPLKTFVVGTNAAGANNGEFVINDLGAAVGGGGSRRMTITNTGNVIFTGTVSSASSARYKRDITTLTGASASLDRLRGVRFVRMATGQQELGLIAEEVAEVYPELVEHDATTGQVEAVNYSALTAVLLQALKEQQARLEEQQTAIAVYQTRTVALEARVTALQDVNARLADLERRLVEGWSPVALTGR